MDVFPSELFTAIIDEVSSTNDLLSLRSVCKSFHSLVTPRAFRSIRVGSTEESIKKLQRLEDCEEIREFVQEVHIVSRFLVGWNNAARPSEIPPAFYRLSKFSSLRTLCVAFEDATARPLYDFDYEGYLLYVIAQNWAALGPDYLSISNLAAHDHHVYRLGWGYLSSIKAIALRVISDEIDTPRAYLAYHLCDFWSEVVTQRYLEPMQSCLTSLTLHSDQYVGLIPQINVQTLYFPRLDFVSLGRIIITDVNPDCDFEVFIIRHKATLQKVELHNCPIFVPLMGQTRIWSQVWEQFHAELDKLVDLVVRRDPNIDGQVEEYIGLDEGWGYIPEYDVIVGSEGDATALQSLQSAIEARERLGNT